MAAKGTSARGIEWAQHNLHAAPGTIARWNAKAPGEWCGIFLAALMRSQGIKPPSGYPAAVNWSNFGTKVNSLSEAQPGDVLVYGSRHVAMYLGSGRQIQGNNHDGTVGEGGMGPGQVTAIRRPPWTGSGRAGGGFEDPLSPAERQRIQKIAKNENLGEGFLPSPSDIAGEVLSGLLGDLAKSAEPLMLNIALIGGGAFLAYYGTALTLGVKRPIAKLGYPITKGAP